MKVKQFFILCVCGLLVILINFPFIHQNYFSSVKVRIVEKYLTENDITKLLNSNRVKSLSHKNIIKTNTLILINEKYKNSNKEEITLTSASSYVNCSRANILVNKEIVNSLKKLFTVAKNDGFGNLVVTSGFRSKKKQKQIYDNSVDKSQVQPPGYSEHETGLAIDIQLKSGDMERLGETNEGKWLEKNAWKYGFILRYPKEKTDITKISPESWHYRYVGLPHSAYMKKYNLCLEEYIAIFSTEKGLKIKMNEKEYFIFRTNQTLQTIKIPIGFSYELSFDNTGGYIVTMTKKSK